MSWHIPSATEAVGPFWRLLATGLGIWSFAISNALAESTFCDRSDRSDVGDLEFTKCKGASQIRTKGRLIFRCFQWLQENRPWHSGIATFDNTCSVSSSIHRSQSETRQNREVTRWTRSPRGVPRVRCIHVVSSAIVSCQSMIVCWFPVSHPGVAGVLESL